VNLEPEQGHRGVTLPLGKQLPVFAEDVDSTPSTELLSDDSDSESDDDDCDWSPSLFSVTDTLTIFDWDDTLLPTTWIEAQGLRLDDYSTPTEDQRVKLQSMAEQAMKTLEIAKMHGKVIVVTNAGHGWVEQSCQKFMPSLGPLLRDLKIVSARSAYEPRGVALASEWKYFAFQSEIFEFCESFNADRSSNIISVGDSPHERQALIRVTEGLNSCVKALKLTERPGLDQLVDEHQLIGGCFRDIVNHDGNLDLCFRCP